MISNKTTTSIQLQLTLGRSLPLWGDIFAGLDVTDNIELVFIHATHLKHLGRAPEISEMICT